MKNISISLLKKSRIKKESKFDSIESFNKISSYIYYVHYHHLEHEREIRLNLNKMKFNLYWRKTRTKRKENKKHGLIPHTIFITVIRKWSRKNIIFFFFLIRSLISLALATWSRSLLDRLGLLSTKGRRFLIFSLFLSLRLFFRRGRFLCVSFDSRHVNEIRSLVVIRSTIVRIFFIYFVNETRLITLCSLTNRNDDV